MPGTGSGDMYALANDYLEACRVALIDTPAGAPDRYFVSPGVPAWDCPDQLTVHVGGPSVGPTSAPGALSDMHRIATLQQVNIVALTATILRCTPTFSSEEGDPPTPLQNDETSQQTLADLWAIWNHVSAGKRSGTLFGPKDREFAWDPAVSLIVQGGVCGWQVSCRVQLDGYSTQIPPE